MRVGRGLVQCLSWNTSPSSRPTRKHFATCFQRFRVSHVRSLLPRDCVVVEDWEECPETWDPGTRSDVPIRTSDSMTGAWTVTVVQVERRSHGRPVCVIYITRQSPADLSRPDVTARRGAQGRNRTIEAEWLRQALTRPSAREWCAGICDRMPSSCC
jgi:hypothetical protein